MTTPTPERRSAIYKEAKVLIITKEYRFITTAIRAILIRRYGCNIKVKDIEMYFIELSRRLPIGDKSRIHVLTECEKESEYSKT